MRTVAAGIPAQRHAYGPDPQQFGDLYLPAAPGERPVVVVVHGGFWRARYDLGLGEPLARDLVARGFAVWNVEYRRVGNGGGWPATVLDVAAAVDRLEVIARGTDARSGPPAPETQQTSPLDLGRVIALGHSAGGHLAAWLAGRPRLSPPWGPPRVPITGVVSQAGVLDLETAAADRLGEGAVDAFLGTGWSGDWPAVSPAHQLPVQVPVRCVHGDSDDAVPIRQSVDYVSAARSRGSDAELITIPGGDHFGVITPGHPGWAVCVQAIVELAATT